MAPALRGLPQPLPPHPSGRIAFRETNTGQPMAYTAAAIGFFTFALGWVVAGFLPEPQFANHEGGHDSDDEDIEEEETTAPSSQSDDESGEKSSDEDSNDDKQDEKPV